MDEDQSSGPSVKLIDGEEADAEWLQLIKTNHDVNVRVSEKIRLDEVPKECNLMVISNILGLLIVAGNTDIRIHKLADFHAALEGASKDATPSCDPLRTISLSTRPVWIRLALGEQRLVAATSDGSGISAWKLDEVLSGNTSPYMSITTGIPPHLLDLLPNPATPGDAQAKYIALLAGEGVVVADIESGQIMSTIQGSFTSGSWSAKGKQMILGTSDGKLVQYTPEGTPKNEIPLPQSLDASSSYYASSVQWLETDLLLASYAQMGADPSDPLDVYVIQRTKGEITYTKFFDPLDTMGVSGRSGSSRFYASLKGWGSDIKYLAFMMSGMASEVQVFKGSSEKWEALILSETARAIMPTGKKGISDDTSCIGMALDLTTTKPVRQGIIGGIEQPDLPPPPRLLVYSQEGFIISFNIQYPEGGPYPGMITPQSSTSNTSSSPQAAPVEEPKAAPTPAPSAFASSADNTKPAFGSSAFGQAASPSAFGTPSTQSAFGASAFGQPSKPAFSGFGQSSTPAPAFGQASTPSAFGQSAFGQSSKPSTGLSAFGSVAAPSSGFGAFGISSTTPSSGSAFGASAFGQTAKPAATSTDEIKPSPFGATSSGSAFGSNSAFGSKAFGKPAFGQTPTPAASGSAFGNSGFGQSAFGQKSTPTPAATSGSAFSGFGKTSSASSGSGAFSQTSSSSSPAATPPAKSQDDFGLGGFASALESSKPAVVPGLDDSPPSSPKFTGKAPGLDESPPPSPPFKPTTRLPTQLVSSNASSFIKPATAFAGASSGGFGVFGQASSTPKTPSAFGSGTPAAFSGSPSTPTPSSNTPTAFGAPAFGKSSTIGSTSSTPGFGTSAFGQSSKPVGFGTPSKPSTTSSAFANVSSGGGFGGFAANSTGGDEKASTGFGGFGGFAASSPSVFGQTTKNDIAPVSEFGVLLSQSAGTKASSSDNPKSIFGSPSASSAATSKPPVADPDAFAMPKAKTEEEIKGFEVPSVKAQAAIASKPEGKEPKPDLPAPETQKPAESAKVESPSSADAKSQDQVESSSQVEAKPTEVITPPSSGGEENLGSEPEVVDDHQVGALHQGEEDEVRDEDEEEEQQVDDHEEFSDEDEDAYEDEDEEDYEDDFEDEQEAGEVDDEEEEAGEESDPEPPARRRSSSLAPPDMSPIQELPEEDLLSPGQEVEVKTDTSSRGGLKSPPTWFASSAESAKDGNGNNDSSSGPGASLLSRLGAPPASNNSSAPVKAASAFNLKHAARTSSPLGTQPPQIATSTTPESSPAKTVPNAFNLFGHTKSEDKPTPAVSGINLFGPPKLGQPAVTTTTPTPLTAAAPPTPPVAKSTSPSSGFFTIPTKSSQSSATSNIAPKSEITSLFGAKPANTPASDSTTAKSPFGASLGLGRPPVPPAQASQNLTPQATTSLFGFKQPTAPATTALPPVQATNKAPTTPQSTAEQAKAPTAVVTTFSIPPRQPAPAATQLPEGNKSLASVLSRMMVELGEDLKILRATLVANDKYHNGVCVSGFVKIGDDDLNKHKAIPLSAVESVSNIASSIASEARNLRNQADNAEKDLTELSSRMLKTDLKVSQAKTLLQARKDPELAKTLYLKDLHPDQSASQIKLRKALQTIDAKIEELESGIANLRRKAEIRQSAQQSLSAQDVERLQRTVLGVDAAVRDRAQVLEDLATRVGRMRLGTPSKDTTPSGSPTTSRLSDNYLNQSFSATQGGGLAVPQTVASEARITLKLQQSNIERLNKRFSGFKTRLTDASTITQTKEPIRIAGLHRPDGENKKDTDLKAKGEPAPQPSFAGLSFSLDPSLAATPTPASNRAPRGGGPSRGHREHTAAAKFSPSTSSPTAAMPGGFSFGLPPPIADAEDKKPQGFFSLSDYGK